MDISQLFGGVAVLVLGALISLFAWRLPYESDVGPGPGFMPLWIGIGLGLCGLATTIRAARALRPQDTRFFLPKTKQVVLVFATLVATFLLLPVLGLTAGLALFMGFTMRVTGRHGWLWCGLATVACAAAVRIVFGFMLDIPLPRGLIGV